MRKGPCLFIAFALFASCSDNAFEEILSRTVDDPSYDTPSIDSLSLEHAIYLSWDEDDACDTFYLMRSYDQSVLRFSCIYEGRQTAYTDVDLMNDNRYVYRLDKTRGKRYFEGLTYAYGYSSDCRRDACEPNDREEDATFLEHDRICNLTCVGFETGNKEMLDEDWFYVTIPPMRQADIVVGQHNLDNSTVGAKTNLRIQVPGFDSQNVKHQTAYPIQNTGYETKNFYFKIFPERTSLSSGNSFCTVIEYTVSLNQIVKY